MFPSAVYTRAWADKERKKLGNCDPGLLEKCVRALTLLGHLADSGLPFMFKGGTSILLHLPDIRRLSIDIDIVSPAGDDELNRVVARIGRIAPFTRSEESVRGTTSGREPLPRRRHFRFWFPSERAKTGEDFILLDVVQEEHCPHVTVQRTIRTSFVTPDREIRVALPTVESLLGDKLTAFAPTTTGVRLRKAGGDEGETMQVAKQLFDVGVLFEHATDFAEVARVYDGVQAQESGYRENLHSREATLTDTLNACLGVTGQRVRLAPATVFPDAPLLVEGFDRLTGHLTQPRIDDNGRRILAARAGVLAAHLRAGRALDFAAIRYTQTAAQLETLRAATLKGHPHAWLDGIKAGNAEAYHYWHMGLTL
ncbi:MAG: nucleotidyl transferase AbiEii/AbiGii toxin family protein [Verrucomicrobia bacterium]|nr:nucleotidyl transferase AbiEii/AbiGii toxin family protein [Verrucomicrobiota bacterium]